MYNTELLTNRLRKMARHYDKWARRQGISCYRIYDADVPEFPLAIDRYADYVHVAEYRRDHTLSPEEHRGWVADCRVVIQQVLEVPATHIFFKVRDRQRGNQQYDRVAERQFETVVEENGLKFWVNLSDYLDTGLFLDHRITRQWVRERSMGARVLNLFAYTGSFSIYAAAGGAVTTTTIDLSNTYLQWAERNLQLNQQVGPQHRLLRADVKQWLADPVQEAYDIIILDPPTFSNSKAMPGVLDTQQDHAAMINHCLRRLRRGGVLFFSTNYRRFKLEANAIHTDRIRDVTAASIPADFRNKKIHYCWEINPAQ